MTNTFERLLVPLDGSRASAVVLDYLAPLLPSFENITLMHVVHEDPPPSMMIEDHGGGLFLANDAHDGPSALNYLKHVCEGFGDAAAQTTCIARAGKPASEVIDALERESVSLVAMATHGAGGLERWALGSHTEKVRRSRPPTRRG
jgi:nucleotide-binding universal stress UspA family protein